jgi:ribosomal protein L27
MILNVVCIERDQVGKGRIIVQQKGSRLTKILNIGSDSSHHCRSFRTQV